MFVILQIITPDDSTMEQDIDRSSIEMNEFSMVSPGFRHMIAQCLLNKEEVLGNIM